MKTEELIKIKPYISNEDYDKIRFETRNIECVLPDYNNIIKGTRKTGNTTRIIDSVIQLLFERKIVLVIDIDWRYSIESNINLLSKVIERLYREHKLTSKNIKTDKYKTTIELVNI